MTFAVTVQVLEMLGLDAVYKAQRLQRRAHDMLHRGFEWALLHGEPRNPTAQRYPLMPPLCDADGIAGSKTGANKLYAPALTLSARR